MAAMYRVLFVVYASAAVTAGFVITMACGVPAPDDGTSRGVLPLLVCDANYPDELLTRWPVAGADHFVGNYFDHDPAPDATMDYRGNRGAAARTYESIGLAGEKSGHLGIDISPSTLARDTVIVAPADGYVVSVEDGAVDYAGLPTSSEFDAFTNLIQLEHPLASSSALTLYGHVKRDSAMVQESCQADADCCAASESGCWCSLPGHPHYDESFEGKCFVPAGTPLALIGHNGYSSHPHLHFELAIRQSAANQLDYVPVDPMGCRDGGSIRDAWAEGVPIPEYDQPARLFNLVVADSLSGSIDNVFFEDADSARAVVKACGGVDIHYLRVAEKGAISSLMLELVAPDGEIFASYADEVAPLAAARLLAGQISWLVGSARGRWKVQAESGGVSLTDVVEVVGSCVDAHLPQATRSQVVLGSYHLEPIFIEDGALVALDTRTLWRDGEAKGARLPVADALLPVVAP